MAINQWINVTVSAVASKQTDRADHKNTATQGTGNAGGFTAAWDSAIVTTMTLYDSAAAAARQIAKSQLPP